jgi:hypothetical protein
MDLSVECLEKRRRFVCTENVEKQKENRLYRKVASFCGAAAITYPNIGRL